MNLCSQHEGSALRAACRNGNESIVRLLLDRDVDVNVQSDSAISDACHNGNEKKYTPFTGQVC